MRISRYKLQETERQREQVSQAIVRCRELLKAKGISVPEA